MSQPTVTSKTSASMGTQLFVSLLVLLVFWGLDGFLRAKAHQKPPSLVRHGRRLTDEEMNLARAARTYFLKNRQPSGWVSSAYDFPATTMWDLGSQLAGMMSMRELNLLSPAEFDTWTAQVLASLARIPLSQNELPNKVYNARTLEPVGYGQLSPRRELGFSGVDLGRLLRWLDILASRHPQHAPAVKTALARWKCERLARDGQLMGTELRNGAAEWNQEGRLGYEQYSAYGVKQLGVDVSRSLNPNTFRQEAQVSGVTLSVDSRSREDSVAHNYVTSEPYILDGMESGFRAIPLAYAQAVLQAQRVRSEETGQLTAWSEDNIDHAPWFVYNNLYLNGKTWASIDSSGNDAFADRGSSTKAALAWYALFDTPFTVLFYQGFRWLSDPERGVQAGYYERTQRPNQALTLNTNGIVLEALLYARVGQPLEVWARTRR